MSNTPPNELANRPKQGPPKTATEVVLSMQGEIQRALPRGMDADRVARLALTLIKKDRNLANSTPASFAGALLTASALGLEPGLNNEAHLVAYKDKKAGTVECQLIIGYGGMSKLFWQHPLAEHLDAQAVHENDEFDYSYGLTPHLDHKPARGDRGAVTHYYAVAGLKNGARTFVVLTADEVRKLRGREGTKGGIADPMHWMERKTAIRQLFKLLPKTAELQQAIEAEDKGGTELHAEMVAHKEIEAPPQPIEADVDVETGEVLEGELEEPEGWR